MARVVSLTATKIEELMAGWRAVGYTQDEISALVTQLNTVVQGQAAVVQDFEQQVVPHLLQETQESSQRLSELNETTLPQLQRDLEQNTNYLADLDQLVIPALRYDVEQTVLRSNEQPKVYEQAEEPLNPDDDARDLVVGDTWFDSDDNNRQRIWNGAMWTELSADVQDFSLTAKKFKTSTHMLY